MRNVLVVGIGKSGIAAAKLLVKLGDCVTVQDTKSREKLSAIADELEKEGVELCLGKTPEDILYKFDLIVVSPGVPSDLPFLKLAEEKGIKVIGEIELAYRNMCCNMIAVTGTNGKTTTTALVGEMVKAYNDDTYVVGNIGLPITEVVPLLKDTSWAVAEISSFQLETVDTFRPHISAVLNITPDHIDRHKTLDCYIEMKERIFVNQKDMDFCVLNYDDEVCRKMAEKTRANVLFFSKKEKLSDGVYLDNGAIYLSHNGNSEKIVNTNEINVLVDNAMAAAAIAYCASVPFKIIRSVLKSFKALEHRIEYVDTINGVDFYNDSKASNTDAAIKGIEAMRKPIILICGGYDKGSEFGEWVSTFEGKVKFVFCIGATSSKIIDCMEKYGFKNYTAVETYDEAVCQSFKKASADDCVLLSPACASWDMFSNFEERGHIFKALVKKLKG